MAPVATSLETGELSFGREGVRGYAAWPRGAHPLPGLVLVPDVRGLSEHYRDVARRLAAVFRWMRALPDRRVLADLAAAVECLAGRSEVRADAIGITGFCMGGQYALMAACTVERLAACVSWYGMLRYA